MLFLWMSVHLAMASPAPDVVREVGSGVRVNWTRWRVEVVEGAQDPTVADPRPLEQRAIRAIDARLIPAVGQVPLRPGTLLGAESSVDAARLVQGWWVAETRYFTTGRVQVLGAVDLRGGLSSWSSARGVLRDPDAAGGPSGALIDARGVGVAPCYAPELRDPEGGVLFDGSLWRHEAWDVAPVVWVSDASAPEADKAGATPEIFLAAEAPEPCVVGLSAPDAQRFRERLQGTNAVHTGRVVVVVDP